MEEINTTEVTLTTDPMWLPPLQQHEHRTVNGKYRIVFEKAASANKIDGFKIEINSDVLDDAKSEAAELYIWANNKIEVNKPVQAPGKII